MIVCQMANVNRLPSWKPSASLTSRGKRGSIDSYELEGSGRDLWEERFCKCYGIDNRYSNQFAVEFKAAPPFRLPASPQAAQLRKSGFIRGRESPALSGKHGRRDWPNSLSLNNHKGDIRKTMRTHGVSLGNLRIRLVWLIIYLLGNLPRSNKLLAISTNPNSTNFSLVGQPDSLSQPLNS